MILQKLRAINTLKIGYFIAVLVGLKASSKKNKAVIKLFLFTTKKK